MKFSFAYVKQNPLMFGTIALVFGLFFYVYMNKGANSGGNQVIQTGPSDMAVQAQLQMAALNAQASAKRDEAQAGINIAQIQAKAQTDFATLGITALSQQGANNAAIANIGAQVALFDTAANERVASRQIDASTDALMARYATEYAITVDNNQTTVEQATLAYNSANFQVQTFANLQLGLGQQQSNNFIAMQNAETDRAAISGNVAKVQSIFGAIGDVKPNDRDNAFAFAVSGVTGTGLAYSDRTSGSFTTYPSMPSYGDITIQ
jgi:hypothetical protein